VKTKRHVLGFSLVEMLAAAAILSMLALMGVPYAQSAKDRELEMALRDTLTRLRWAINTYAWNEDTVDEDGDGVFGEDPAGDPDGDGTHDDDRDGSIDEDGPPNYPASLVDLRIQGYLATVPRDPFDRNPASAPETTWTTIGVTRRFVWFDQPPPGNTDTVDETGIIDVRSSNYGTGLDGTRYASW